MGATESQGCRKFTLHDPAQPFGEVLKLWVFALDMRVSYSSSTTPTDRAAHGPARVAKIFYQTDTPRVQVTNGQKLSSGALSESEMELDSDELNDLMSALQQSTERLPEKAKYFPPNWNVGLLRRFTEKDGSS